MGLKEIKLEGEDRGSNSQRRVGGEGVRGDADVVE